MVALVPETKAATQRFFETELASPPDGFPDWAYNHFGYLTWQELAVHCTAHTDEWPQTVANFDYNRGQIFGVPLDGIHAKAGDALVSIAWSKPTGFQRSSALRRGALNRKL